ncbi:PepSY domain-containing protein [Roseococcus pinisoli]|uniref:PepSY domain-containing protein n=1 Tax=Roseococcus pinisoli TaxID=2835040 RepID=A0ABS5QDK8_9PROT|nr:PepSY domain-containing protein [Roseococcus pinisoli]MBS7811786.1 hypothetical protein [Roseococcus pinisoli]
MLLRAAPLMLLIGLAALQPQPAIASSSEREELRLAVERGQVRPMSQFLGEVERRHNGRVIEAELDRHRGRIVWEVKILPAQGRTFKVRLDAATGVEIPRDSRD